MLLCRISIMLFIPHGLLIDLILPYQQNEDMIKVTKHVPWQPLIPLRKQVPVVKEPRSVRPVRVEYSAPLVVKELL